MIRNYCVFISAAYNFVMRMRSPLLPLFTVATNKLDEAGITLHWSIKPVGTLPRWMPVARLVASVCVSE